MFNSEIQNSTPSLGTDYYKILSIDGGGIRGLYPATFLANLQDKLESVQIYQYFDLIVGTSTGGIIAIALSLGIHPKKIVTLYKDEGKNVFKQEIFRKGIRRPKYSNIHLVSLLKEIYGEETHLKDAKTALCLPSVNINTASPKVFKTPRLPEIFADAVLPCWKVAAATAAAPVFFPAVSVYEDDAHVDGGLWANNPAMVGVTEAIRIGYSLKQIKLLSIGTGKVNLFKTTKESTNAGILSWKDDIFNLMGLTQSESTHNMIGFWGLAEYCRINSSISPEFSIDNIEHLGELEEIARQKSQETIQDVIQRFF